MDTMKHILSLACAAVLGFGAAAHSDFGGERFAAAREVVPSAVS